MFSKVKRNNSSFSSLTFLFFLLLLVPFRITAEDGYRLWLRYDRIANENKLKEYRKNIKSIHFPGDSPTLKAAREELTRGLTGLLDSSVRFTDKLTGSRTLIVGTPKSSRIVVSLSLAGKLKNVGKEGYIIQNAVLKGKKCIVIAANTDIGVLYGVFNFLKIIQTNKNPDNLKIIESPKIEYRLLNHWNNLLIYSNSGNSCN